MKKNRIKAYWLLLMVLLYAAGAVLSVGEAQARYVTTATWNTVVQQEANSVTSDCLEDVSGAPLTILLGTMSEETYPVSFHLTAGEDVSGNLAWTVDRPEYISVQMHIGDTEIKPETTIEIAAGDTITVVMTLIPSETAFTEVREAVSASIAVTWADTLKGTFLTQLPAVEEEEEPTEVTEPPTEETEPDPTQPSEPAPTDPTEPEPTNPTEPEPTNPTEPEPTDPAEPAPTNPTDPGTDVTGLWIPEFISKLFEKNNSPVIPNNENSGDETIPEEEATQPAAETEPSTPDDPDGQSEETPDPSEPEVPEDGTGNSGDTPDASEETTEDPTEPTEPAQEEPPMDILLEAISSVNSAEALPIQITATENGGQVRLGIATVVQPTDPEGESQTILEDFPQYTRFSLTDGASYYMLYRADTIALNLEAEGTISVLLDLSRVNLEQFQVTLGAAPRNEMGEIITCATMVLPKSTQYTALNSRILSIGTPLEITVSDYWKDYDLEYTVEMLSTIQGEDGETVGYVPADLPEGCLLSEFVADETGAKLIFTLGETLPPAGTYRVSLNWTFEDTCYAQTQEIFFINYLAYTESEKTGGAEQ